MEDRLAERYKKAVPGVLAALRSRCRTLQTRLTEADESIARLEDVRGLRADALGAVIRIGTSAREVLDGVSEASAAAYGRTREDRKSTRLNSSHPYVLQISRMPSSA